jgi:hypothetical protein
MKVLNGYKCAVFAYGATGSGKTHTMFGTVSAPGIIPRSTEALFYMGRHFKFACSMLEIYKESLNDLLSRGKELRLKEVADHGFVVEGLSEVTVCSREDVARLLEQGEALRKFSSTRVNSKSSRSHTIFTIKMIEAGRSGRLALVDLAGSENVLRSGASG